MLRKFLLSILLGGPILLAGCSAIPFADHQGRDDVKVTKKKEEKSQKGLSRAIFDRQQIKEEKKLAAIAARPEISPDTLYSAGVRSVNAGDSKNAQKAFNELNNQHPFSSEAQKALVLSAYTHFRTKEYDQAIGKAQQFLQLYPGSSDAAYMQYLIGESYFQQVGAIVLDQADAAKGLRAYGDLVRLYPDSKYVPDARKKILFMNDQLAGKEMQIGRYYQERQQHVAALNRFRTVVENYQTTNHIEEALFRLTESNLSLGLVNDARATASLLGHNYPNSSWYKDAYKLLSSKNIALENKKAAPLAETAAPVVQPAEKAAVSAVAIPDGAAPLVAAPSIETPAPSVTPVAEAQQPEGSKFSRFVPFVGKKKTDEKKS